MLERNPNSRFPRDPDRDTDATAALGAIAVIFAIALAFGIVVYSVGAVLHVLMSSSGSTPAIVINPPTAPKGGPPVPMKPAPTTDDPARQAIDPESPTLLKQP